MIAMKASIVFEQVYANSPRDKHLEENIIY